MVHTINVCITVIEDLIDSAELNLIVTPDLILERLLRDDLTDITPDIIESLVFRVLRITEGQTQATGRTIRQFDKDRL